MEGFYKRENKLAYKNKKYIFYKKKNTEELRKGPETEAYFNLIRKATPKEVWSRPANCTFYCIRDDRSNQHRK